MEWIKKHPKITICLLLFGAIALVEIVHQIGFNAIINVFLSLPIILLLTAIIVVLTIKGHGKQTYQVSGAILTWIVIHLLWYKFSPETLILAAGTNSFWFAEALFLCVLALLNKITFGIYIINYVTLALMFGAVAFQFYFFFAGPAKRIEFRNYCDSIYYQNVVDQLEKTNKEAAAVPLKMRLKKLEEEAEKDLDPNKNNPKRVAEVKKEIAEIKQELQAIYPPPPQPEKRERIVREFDIPAGNGKNKEGNIFFTNLPARKGDLVRYTILSGTMIVDRSGKRERDKVIIRDNYNFRATGPGMVQFIKHKPAKVRVEIIPRT